MICAQAGKYLGSACVTLADACLRLLGGKQNSRTGQFKVGVASMQVAPTSVFGRYGCAMTREQAGICIIQPVELQTMQQTGEYRSSLWLPGRPRTFSWER